MGIPGLLNVLIKTYGDNIYSSNSDDCTCAAIDGNVLLYQFMETSKDLNPYMFCSYLTDYVSRYRSVTKFVITFDGLPPHAKLREQTKRRKYRELIGNPSISLTSGNRGVLMTIEQILLEKGWIVISHLMIGEGEQKLANFILTSNMNNIMVITRDWDFLLMLLPLCLNKKIHLDMMFIKRTIDVTNILEMIGVDKILHFTSCVILFGTDFFPGVSNLALTVEHLNMLLILEPWSLVINSNVVILKTQFLSAIELLLQIYRCQLTHGCNNCKICIPPHNNENSIISFICNYAWTIGYFYLRNHNQIEVSKSNQCSTNDLGVNLIDLKNYFSDKIQNYISIDVKVDIIDNYSYDIFLSNMNNINMTILPACAFNIKPYCPFLLIEMDS
jgi:hypothetical protein